MMTIDQATVLTPEGVRLYTCEWLPETASRAAILIIHGLGEHSGRYNHVARTFTQAGYAVFALDLRGHGRSEGKRGHVSSFDEFYNDFDQMLKQIEERFPGLPRILYGHSMGGTLVLSYIIKRNPNIVAAIVTSPGLAPAKDPGATLLMGRLLNPWLPSLLINNGLDLSGLSRDPDVVKAYTNDPLVHPHISLRLGLLIIETGRWLQNWQGQFPVPLLLMQGTADRLVNPNATRKFAQNVKGAVTYIEWPGYYHELHNEPEKADVLHRMVTWLESIVPSSEKGG